MELQQMIARDDFVNQLRQLNYKQAWNMFLDRKDRFFNEDGSVKPEYEKLANAYIENITPKGIVQDCREGTIDKAQIQRFVNEGFLFVYTGASCSGKTTNAKKFAKAFNIEVVDIDEFFQEYLKKGLGKCKNEKKREKFLRKAGGESDFYIRDHLESEILRKSDNGKKSLVLVGGFLELIFRSIVRYTLGKHFNGVVNLMVVEDWNTLAKRQEMRLTQSGNYQMEVRAYYGLRREFLIVESLIDEQMLCGYGGDYVYIIKSETELF